MHLRPGPDVILDFDAAWFIQAAGTHLHAISEDFFAHAEGAAADRAEAALRERGRAIPGWFRA